MLYYNTVYGSYQIYIETFKLSIPIIYAYMQDAGMVNNRIQGCLLYKIIID